MHLTDKIRKRQGGILLYGITPPKANNSKERVQEIATKQLARIKDLPIDGLIIYDIQDETARTHEARPFEFIHTVDPSLYSRHYLRGLEVPRVVYRCVGNYSASDFSAWLKAGDDELTVFVGTVAGGQQVKLTLEEAYHLRNDLNPDMLLGAVTIPERHRKQGNEDSRVGFKMGKGCGFFVSQAVYDLAASKEFLRDYKAYCQRHDMAMVPIIFTLTPCGSAKTLKFIKWLGISVPETLEAALMESGDEMLAKSLELVTSIYRELKAFAEAQGIPIGCNVESVSIRKVEIDAAVQLAHDIAKIHKIG